MKHTIALLMAMMLFSCQSVKKKNLFLEKPIPAAKLIRDIDFTYAKLQKFHPNLYWYISKEQLDHQFDSLKTTIHQPLTPNQFYFKLAPVIASINEGHLRLRSIGRTYSKAEQKDFKTKKPLFAMMEYKIINDRIFVKENRENVAAIKTGTEILKINNENVSDIIKKYRKLYSSDGENSTFQKYFINLTFFNFYTLENGYLDSVKLKTICDNTVQEVHLKRQKKETKEIADEKILPKLSADQKIQDYDATSKSYNRSFKFLKTDSTVAYIKIKSFSASYARKFYSETFTKIRKAKSTYLILDIRDNLGGSLSEINTLYSYLTDQRFTLIKAPEMTAKTSGMHQNYFRGQSVFTSILSAPAYPFFLAGNYLLSSRKDKKYYFREFASRSTKPKENAFKGKIYVLVNGASFSASSIISAKLKFENRAIIVGEETGGANDGTVAGVNNTVVLPNSRLTLPIGLFLIRPNITFENQNRGVVPHFYVDPNFEDLFGKEDRILQWTLDDIDFRNKVTSQIK